MITPWTHVERRAQAEAPAVAGCFDAIFASLLHYIAAAFRPLGSYTIPAWTRISRTRVRLARLLALLAAGRLPRVNRSRVHTAHVHTARVHTTCPAAPERQDGPPAPYLPRRPGWLGHVAGYQLRGVASQLNHLLHLPETQATLAAAPPQLRAAIASSLKTACRLLGITLPEPLRTALPTRATKPRRTKPPASPVEGPAATPYRPLPAYVRAAVRAWKPKYG